MYPSNYLASTSGGSDPNSSTDALTQEIAISEGLVNVMSASQPHRPFHDIRAMAFNVNSTQPTVSLSTPSFALLDERSVFTVHGFH